MPNELPVREHDYQNLFMDSRRWDGFEPRDDDIIVCTPYKSGTTWTQMICALLVFRQPELPRPLAEISPWLDLRVTPLSETLALYAAQTHRRIIKTHTPLDGLPYFPRATYLYCGRDPREIFISMVNHGKNQRTGHFIELLEAQGISVTPPPPPPEDIDERFRLWITKGAFPWEDDGFPFWSVFSHARTFWRFAHLPNLHFLHYAVLKADLEGEMRRIAKILGITIPASEWPALVQSATFASMKDNAAMTAPDTQVDAWVDPGAFFHKGELGQWRNQLSAASLALYDSAKQTKGDQRFIDWLERGIGGPLE